MPVAVLSEPIYREPVSASRILTIHSFLPCSSCGVLNMKLLLVKALYFHPSYELHWVDSLPRFLPRAINIVAYLCDFEGCMKFRRVAPHHAGTLFVAEF